MRVIQKPEDADVIIRLVKRFEEMRRHYLIFYVGVALLPDVREAIK
jgi:hypothetical protein